MLLLEKMEWIENRRNIPGSVCFRNCSLPSTLAATFRSSKTSLCVFGERDDMALEQNEDEGKENKNER